MTENTQFEALLVQGADAATFLNGQFTSNVLDLADGVPRLGAFCTPKGRALAVAVLLKKSDDILMWTTASRRVALQTHLARYVMRADVRFMNAKRIGVFGKAAAPELDLPGGPFSLCADNLAARAANAGVPLFEDGAEDAFVPQMLNLDLLGGIDFTKGCYTGQEIVARTHHLGTIKRRMLAFGCDNPTQISVGDDVRTSEGDAAGRVVIVGDDRVLASVRLATLDKPLLAGAVALGDRLALPYSIPELD